METGAVFGACFFACVLESGVLYYLPTGVISLSKRLGSGRSFGAVYTAAVL